jgi:hypothetical protein
MFIEPNIVVAWVVFGGLGMIYVAYGKWKDLWQPKALGFGLMFFPYFVSSSMWLWGNTESRDLRCSGLGRADILVRRQPKLIDLTHPLLWTRMSALPRVNPPPRSDPRSDLFYKWKAELKDRYERLPV